MPEGLSRRSHSWRTEATFWREIWEAGPYYERVSEALENAKRYAVIAGWQIDSRLPLPLPGPLSQTGINEVETLRAKLVRLCQKNANLEIYLLIWDHAYFYMAERELWQGRIWENIHPRVHFVFDNRHPFGASHHEKICIIDGDSAFCGGIDLCDERWDSPKHLYEDARRSLDLTSERHGPYHDLAVEVRGPVCDVLLNQLRERWRQVCNIPFPKGGDSRSPLIPSAPKRRVYVSRTQVDIEAGTRSGKIRREVEFLFRELIGQARHRIILEGQYYWSLLLHDALKAKIAAMRGHSDFEILLLVAELETVNSPTRHMAAFEARLLRDLEISSAFSGVRFRALSPRVFHVGRHPRPVYVHSKILLIDNRYVSIGSTNLASRALRLDTETHLTWEARTPEERKEIRQLADRMLAHWGIADASSVEPPSEARAVNYHPGLRTSVRIGRPGPRWESLFDPVAPLFFFLKRRLRHFPQAWIAWCWAMSIALPALWVEANLPEHPIPRFLFIALSLVLGSVWWVPLPYFGILCILTAIYGFSASAPLLWISFWSAALWGYAAARIAPETAWAKVSPRLSKSALRLAGSRNFENLLRLTFDPRVGVRSKISAQGLYHLPLPWFLWTLGILLPAWLSLVLWSFWRVLWLLANRPI